MSATDFWIDKDKAQKVVEDASRVRGTLQPFVRLGEKIEDIDVLLLLAEEEGDQELGCEARDTLTVVTRELDTFELQQLLSGQHDAGNAFFTLHAGAGGTESCDWAAMLLRMYQRWAERSGYKVTLLDIQEGEEAGIRSVSLHVVGEYAYGYMQCERGVHRLVRISPFDANNRRHTSFASVDVAPETGVEIEIELEEKDLKIDTYRSGGKGGQNVNKVETAVRITHLPSGVVVACQSQRSQAKNRSLAMKMLKSKLYQIEEDKKQAEMDRQYGEKGEIAWGSQIRSYVFQPYQMVKDHRTSVETSGIQEVMDGGIDAFIEAQLRSRNPAA